MLLFFMVLFPFNAQAEPTDQQWFNLNHYNEDGISDIANADYFLAKDGQINPYAEYEAFAKLLQHYQNTGKGAETLCDFPARLTYAVQTFSWFNDKDRPTCTDYQNSVRPAQIQSISLLFASGYFNNPSSYYGHTLLRFNYDDDRLRHSDVDASLNYGADALLDSEGTLPYIYRGLTGGYKASYQQNNDFIHSHRYTNGQLRDLWEYRLNLTPDQIRFIAEHSWEMRRASFDYYFLNDNCAHRIINMVERAIGKDLTKSHGFWLIPIQVVSKLSKTDNKGQPLIQDEIYHPSLKSRFSSKYDELPYTKKKALIGFFDARDEDRKQLVKGMETSLLVLTLEQLDIMVAKLSIKKDNDAGRKTDLEEMRRVVLSELFRRDTNRQNDSSQNRNKDKTLLDYKPASALRLGYRYKNTDKGHENVATLNYQIANNDLMDMSMEGQERSKFIMGSLSLELGDNEIDLSDLTIVDIINLNTNPLPARLTDEYSWQVRVGYNDRNALCDGCGTFDIGGKYGKAFKLKKNIIAYTLIGGTIHHADRDDFGYATIENSNGLLINLNDNTRSAIALDYRINPFDTGAQEAVFSFDTAYNITKDKDVRFEFESDDDGNHLIGFRLGHYFD